MKKLIGMAAAAALVMTGCSSSGSEDYAFTDIDNGKVEHLHGAGYPNAQEAFVIATHDGLLKYEDGKWSEANSKKHDYMGFSPYSEGFYSSGHPEEGSDLQNPLGLVKSTDYGASLEKLAFYGETDFHYLATGYDSGVVYVLNQEPNSELEAGLYSTDDEGQKWEKKKMDGFDSTGIGSMAVHPTDPNLFAIASRDGLFLSEDGGNSFNAKTEGVMTTGILLSEKTGVYSSIENGKITLVEFNLESGKETPLQAPDLKEDNPIMHITQNPDKPDELTVVTYKNDIYRTTDKGGEWEEIMSEGQIE
ncbi:sialidase [Rossellomorea aquimaris]|uniref:F510_1955 family glycosylhydrolase n=1 Tax=Rossellomorea aquimaris TaxID=189382 RepID=UPI001CD1F94B|nr:sialidase [Rossellomorea aquimaris]MCA1055343.1 sialidase [Rossellomorea aquimaris]